MRELCEVVCTRDVLCKQHMKLFAPEVHYESIMCIGTRGTL